MAKRASPTERLQQQLVAAGERLEKANAERSAAVEEVQRVLRHAQEVFPITELARLTKVSRPTVYAMLKDE